MQRKQSLWLFLSALFMLGIFYVPIYKYTEFGSVGIGRSYLSPLFAGAITVISIVTPFLYKNRKRQMELCLLNILLCIFLLGLIFYTISLSKNTAQATTGADGYYWFGAFIPVINIILLILAWIGIKKDDKLIRSADHLR